MNILWDPDKRQTNLDKHGLDFIDAVMVLDSPYRLDVKKKGPPTMSGSKTTSTTLDELRAASAQGKSKTQKNRVETSAPYAWDGQNEDERPLTSEEMQVGIENYRRQRGRPTGSDKESTTIRIDRDVLAAFRAGGPGWQTRMNAALRDWLKMQTAA